MNEKIISHGIKSLTFWILIILFVFSGHEVFAQKD